MPHMSAPVIGKLYEENMNYECCNCKGIFPVEDAIDGFEQGYKVGFLCPLCGCNLKDNPITAGYIIKSKWYFAISAGYMFLGLLIFEFSESLDVIEYFVFVAGLVLLLVYGYFKHPDLFNQATTTTEMGPGKK